MNVAVCNLDMEKAGRRTRYLGARHDIRSAAAAVHLAAAGCTVTTVLDRRARTLAALAAVVLRSAPQALVVTADSTSQHIVAGLLAEVNGRVADTLVLSGRPLPALADYDQVPWDDPSALLSALGRETQRTAHLSPYTEGALAAQAAPETGLLANSPLLAEETGWLTERLPADATVPLHGLEAGTPQQQRERVLALPPRPAGTGPGWHVCLDAATVDSRTCQALTNFGATLIQLRCTGTEHAGGLLREAVLECEAYGLTVTLHLPDLVSGPWADAAETAEAHGLRVTFDLADPLGARSDEEQAAREALRAVDCPTLHREAELGPVEPLYRLLTGRYPHATAPGPLEVSVADPAHAATLATCGSGLVGLTTTVVVGDKERPAVPMPQGVWTAAGGPVFTVPGLYRVDDGFDIEVLDYSTGRGVTPLVPLVLRFSGPQDVDVFLADADRALAEGVFPAALGRLTALADTSAFDTPDRAAPPTLSRAHVDPQGCVRTGPAGPVLGNLHTPVRELRLAARDAFLRARERRTALGASEGAVTADLSLAAFLDDAALLAARSSRPWLHRYLRVWESAARLPHTAAGALRVAGFGPSLHLGTRQPAGGTDQSTAHPHAPLLIALGNEHLLYLPADRRVLRLTADAAMVTEALLAAGTPDDAVSLLGQARGIPASTAASAVEAVGRMLTVQQAWQPAAQ
ncbi:hypothetical protein [Streptomyces chrestomyceticus]|uniref:hypothetical protein n=1 Tax=Streptomyces chrestomyceticus TaxID=68185 RepID=UPI0033CCD3B7